MKGFAWLALLPYLLGAMAVVGGLTYVYQLVDNSWETDAGVLKGRQNAEAELIPRLTSCNASLVAQGEAVAALNAAGKARQARAEAGIKSARSDAKKAQNEAERLRQASKWGSTGACPAGEALRTVRDGLK